MKIVLPEHIGDIKLGQYQEYVKLIDRELDDVEFNKRKIVCFTTLKYHDLKNLTNTDYEFVLNQIDTALNTEHEFKDRFKFNDYEFGFVPNLNKITQGEYVDIGLYPVDKTETYHNLMAILFRPIVSTDKFGNYIIENYNGTEQHAETMKQIPLSIVRGALVFFCNLGKDLLRSIEKYTDQITQKDSKQTSISQNGDGIQP